jgi:hypothetical protein
MKERDHRNDNGNLMGPYYLSLRDKRRFALITIGLLVPRIA